MDRAQILQRYANRFTIKPVEGYEGIYVRTTSYAERKQLVEKVNAGQTTQLDFIKLLCAASMCDEQGNLICQTPHDIDAFEMPLLETAFNVSHAINYGRIQDKIDAAKKNSAQTA